MTLALPGFADPVGDSQACFRAVLDAMARPGTIHAVGMPAEPPAPLGRAAAAVLLTLADFDTPLWLDPAAADAAPWLAFHCGTPMAALDRAAFVVGIGAVEFEAVFAGTDDGPEDGATVVLQIDALGSGPAFILDGPGLEAEAVFRASLPPGFAASWAANHARFPRGFDVILCAGDRLAALPRSLRLREG